MKTKTGDMDIENDAAHYEAMIKQNSQKVMHLVEVIKMQCDATGPVATHRINDNAIAQFAVQLQAAAGELRMYRELLLQLRQISAVETV